MKGRGIYILLLIFLFDKKFSLWYLLDMNNFKHVYNFPAAPQPRQLGCLCVFKINF